MFAPPLAALVVYWPRITGGGFTIDDWSNRKTMMFSDWQTNVSGFLEDPIGYRSLQPVYTNAYDAVLGSHVSLYLFWSACTAGILGASVAVLLVRCGMPRWAGAAIGVLGVIFPYATITKIWITAHYGNLTGALAVAGILLATQGLLEQGLGKRILYHVGATVSFLISLLIYEIAVPLIVASGAFYVAAFTRNIGARPRLHASTRTRIAALKTPLVRWGADVFVVAVWYASIRGSSFAASAEFDAWHRLKLILSDGARNLAGAFVPFLADNWSSERGPIYSGAWLTNGKTVTAISAVALLAILSFAVPAWRRRRIGDVANEDLLRDISLWGSRIVLSSGFAFLCWAAIFKANDYYRPLPADSAALRVNVIAAFGLSATVVCAIGALAAFTRILLKDKGRIAAPALISILLAFVSLAYVRHARSEISLWNQASTEQVRILNSVRTAYDGHSPPSNSIVLLTDTKSSLADGAEVFFTAWSFPGALQAHFQDLSLDGVPHREGERILCRQDDLVPFGVQFWFLREPATRARYGRVSFVSHQEKRRWSISSQAECEKAVKESGMVLMRRQDPIPPLGERDS